MRFQIRSAFLLALVALGSTACGGGGIEGTYTGGAFFEALRFKSGGKVDVTFAGQTKECLYEVHGREVVLNNEGDKHTFRIDDRGCLDGGGLVGTYCKGGASSTSQDVPATGGSGSMSGTYETKDPEGTTLTLKFSKNGKVDFGMSEEGAQDSSECTYQVQGDQIVVQPRQGFPMTFTNTGRTLEGVVFGERLVFTRK